MRATRPTNAIIFNNFCYYNTANKIINYIYGERNDRFTKITRKNRTMET